MLYKKEYIQTGLLIYSLFFIESAYRTAGYISVHYFRFEHFLFDHYVYFFLSSQLQSVFGRDMLNKCVMFSNSISIFSKIIVIMIVSIIEHPYYNTVCADEQNVN